MTAVGNAQKNKRKHVPALHGQGDVHEEGAKQTLFLNRRWRVNQISFGPGAYAAF